MVAGHQDRRHVHPAKRGRARVARRVEEAVLERVRQRRRGVADDAGDDARERVDEDERGQLAAREDVVADRDLARDERLPHALVDALVVAGDEDVAGPEREAVGERLRQRLAVGREVDHVVDRLPVGRGLFEKRLDAGEERLGLQDHAALAAVGLVVDLPVAARRPLAEAVHAHVQQPLVARAAEDRVVERAPDELGQDGDEVDDHQAAGSSSPVPSTSSAESSKRPSGGRTIRRRPGRSTARTNSGTSGRKASGRPGRAMAKSSCAPS